MSIANKNLKKKGGGGLNCSNQSNSTSSRAKFFASLSLISSVLASALCAQESVVKTDNTLTLTDINAPTITVTTTETKDQNFSWSNAFVPSNGTGSVTWSDSGGNFTATTKVPSNSGNPTTVNQFHLYFNNENSSQILIQNGTNNIKDKVVVKGGNKATSIALDFGKKGLSLSASNSTKGTLYLNFGDAAIRGKTFSITKLTTLNGNLSILGGGGNNSFTVNAETINGDIIFGHGNLDDSQGNSSITITKALKGNISTTGTMNGSNSANKGIKINFTSGATMTGDIKGYGVGYDGLKRMVTFSGGSGTVFTGNVFSHGTSNGSIPYFNKTAGNHVTFESGNMVGSFIATIGNDQYAKAIKGYNNITFKSSGEQTLTGGILAQDSNSQYNDVQATNTLNIGNNTTLKMIAGNKNEIEETTQNGTKEVTNTFNLTSGSIIARGRGINEINLNADSILVLDDGKGEIKTEDMEREDGSFSVNAKSKITFTGANGKIQGKITTNTGSSSITINDSASGTITGNITGSGSNNIVFGAAQGSLRGVQAQPLAPTAPSLTLQGATSTITSIIANSAGTLILDGVNGATPSEGEPSVKATINTITGDLTAQFNGTASKGTQLVMSQGGQTIKNLAFGASSANNKLTLSTGTTTITDQVTLAQNQGIMFDLANNTELALTNGSDSRLTTGEAKGAITLTVADGATGTLSGGVANITNLDFSGSASQTLKLKSGTANFGTITANNKIGSNLIIDGANATGKVSASVNTISGDHLTVNLNGADSKGAELTIKGGVNTIASLTLGNNGSGATKANKLIVTGGETSITNALSANSNQEVEFEIKTGANLAFANGLSNSGGTLNLTSTGTQGQVSQTTVSGNITTTDGKTNLYFKDSLWAPASLSTREVTSSGVVTVSGGTSNIAVDLGGNSGEAQMPIYNVITNDGTNNILVKGPTHIGAQVTYGLSGQTNLIFVSESSGSPTNLSAGADLNNLNDGISMFGKTFSNGVLLTLKDVNVASGSSTASFLSLAGKDSANPAFSFTTQRDTSTNTDTVKLHGVAVGKIQAIGGTVTQDPSTPTVHTYNVILNEGAIFAGNIALYGTNQVINLTMKDSSKLFMNNEALQIENLGIQSNGLDLSNIKGSSFSQKNTIIDLATDGNDFANISRTEGQYRVLVIGSRVDAGTQPYTTPTGLTGNNGLFRVYVDPNAQGTLGGTIVSGAFGNTKAYADRVFVNSGSQGKHYVQAIYAKNTDIESISYHGGGVEKDGNIAIATVQKDLNITFEGADQIQGFEVIGTQLTEGIETDARGQVNGAGAKNYKTFFIDSTVSKGIADGSIQTTTSALGINYDLFLANFNSLNKRMGELRDNNNGQGAWARVFVGGLSTSYGLETQSTYTTIQAGYDYAFGFEGANNYLGVALSYANALTDTKKSIDVGGVVSGIDKTSTNGIEVALYNSYVEDSGWFNDTIFKFSYMMSDVKVINQSDTYSTNNFGIVLSDEFGYRFKLGESKEWYIDPQLEVGFGYFNQSDLKQVLGQATLTGIQDAIATLRARVGANWAYDFKNFTQGKGINASVYLGTYYSYDYINGGEISLVTDLGTKGNLKPLSSTGRFELNVGTNIGVQDNTRIYFDFEKSFGGDITTDYQVNLGVRYSFGESNGYMPAVAKAKEVAPLKVEEVKNTQENQAQKSKITQESK